MPETRAIISASIRSEFNRLGDLAGLTHLILGAATETSALLKQAYEMVAVSTHFRVPLPMQVLVSALGVDYGTWLDATKAHSPAWGLLYYDEDSNDEVQYYRTRNEVVTEKLIEHINGGSLTHSGEVHIMAKLLGACKGRSTAVYRDFCVRVLVPNERMSFVEYEEGLRLYETAIDALPFPDRTLVHHKGLWIKNVGRDPILAGEVLMEALNTPIYPYASRGEADQHIHTSIAAAALDAIKQKKLELSPGKKVVLDHLEQGRSGTFFNPNAIHVQANLIVGLVDAEPEKTADFCQAY